MISFYRKSLYLLLPLSLLLQACNSPEVKQHQSEPVKLKVLLLPFLDFGPFFIAEEEEYFVEQGLQIEFVKMDRSSKAIPLLTQGSLDVLGGMLSPGLLNAMARGASIKLVAGRGFVSPTGCADMAFLARQALVDAGELDSPAQLKGRRISVSATLVAGYFVEKLLNTVGLTLDDVEIVDLPKPAEAEALEKGTIDVAHSAEPWVTHILQAGHAVCWMPGQQAIPDFQFGFVVYGPTLLEENPDVGRRFMVAYFQGVRQYNQGKTKRNLEILAKHTGLDQQLLKQAC